ncbi:MAG: hypothetical protein R3E39_12990 [Anaerolineae bacterium]
MRFETDFRTLLPQPWRLTEIGLGKIAQNSNQLILTLPPAAPHVYHDAQITDYVTASDFRWRPPLHMELIASAQTTPDWGLIGTAGFGFWNHPFMPGERGFRLPQAIWFFFSSPPSRIELAQCVPGAGWKAAVLDARRWQFLALLPTAPIGFLLMRSSVLYRHLWPFAQDALGVREHLLDPSLLLTKHRYGINWQTDSIAFTLDDVKVMQTSFVPRGPLGFIAWVDNQYAIVTPQGKFGSGLVAVENPQSLVLEKISIWSTE